MINILPYRLFQKSVFLAIVTFALGALVVAAIVLALRGPVGPLAASVQEWQVKLGPIQQTLKDHAIDRVVWVDEVSDDELRLGLYYRMQFLLAPVLVEQSGIPGLRPIAQNQATLLWQQGRLTLFDAEGQPYFITAPSRAPVTIDWGILLPLLCLQLVLGWSCFRIVSCLLIAGESMEWSGLLAIVVSIGLTLGFASLLFFLMLAFGTQQFSQPLALLAVAELLLTIGLEGGRWGWTRSVPVTASVPSADRLWRWVLLWAVLLGMAFWSWQAFRHPFGEWDAVAIWNLRASHLAGAATAPRTFDRRWQMDATFDRSMEHTDYPLLLPGVVAIGWAAIGDTATWVPMGIAALVTIGTALLLVGIIGQLGDPRVAAMAGMLVIVSPPYLRLGSSQYADLPVAFYLLGCWGMLAAALHIEETLARAGRLLLAGILGGMLAWTKNEGLVLALIGLATWTAVSLVQSRRHSIGMLTWLRSECLPLAAGAAPVFMVVLFFKLSWAPANDLMEARNSGELWAKLTDIPRIQVILQHAAAVFAKNAVWWAGGPGLLLIGLFVFARQNLRPARPPVVFLFLGLFFALAVIALVYWTTPRDPAWHIDSSLSRLLLQLWPVLFLMIAILLPHSALEKSASPNLPANS